MPPGGRGYLKQFVDYFSYLTQFFKYFMMLSQQLSCAIRQGIFRLVANKRLFHASSVSLRKQCRKSAINGRGQR